MSSIESIKKSEFLVVKEKLIQQVSTLGKFFAKKDLIRLVEYLFHPEKRFPNSIGVQAMCMGGYCYFNFSFKIHKNPSPDYILQLFESNSLYEQEVITYLVEIIQCAYTPECFNAERAYEVLAKFD